MAEKAKGRDLPDDVHGFLEAVRNLLEFHPQAVSWIGRQDRIEELSGLGLTMNQALDVIRHELEPGHRHRGPEPDDHAPGTGVVAIFRCPICDHTDAYVKIGLRLVRSTHNPLRLVIWSFKRWD